MMIKKKKKKMMKNKKKKKKKTKLWLNISLGKFQRKKLAAMIKVTVVVKNIQ